MQSSYFGKPRSTSKLWTIGHWFGPYAPLIVMFISGLVFLSLTRLGLVAWKWERVLATGELWQILLQGVRVDVIQLGLLALIPVLLSPILATRKFFNVWRGFTFWWVLLSLVLLVFLEAATPGFILEYDVRPNRIFVEYLKYPHEVFGMLWQGFKLELFFGLLMTAIAFALVAKLLKPWRHAEAKWASPAVWLIWPLILVLTVFGIRSTLTHRPANPALFAITQDSMVNSLILNSTYSVFYAAYSLQHEAKSSAIYGKLPREKIFALTGAHEADIPT